ncbi:MAG: hypothetical protein IT429_23695 [Gemmataceae bacterium]|nr:hypothetical protein [Gemmataceae bacterium]
MSRLPVLAAVAVLAVPPAGRADTFDRYTNEVLAKVPGAPAARRVTQLTPALLTEHVDAIPGISGALLVVKTNDGRFSKLVVQAARQKVSDKVSLPILLIDRFVTYREGEEKTIQTAGQNVRLFGGFRFNLDLGQVVPASVEADVRFVSDEGKNYAEPVGKAEFYLLTKPLPEAAPKKGPKLVIGDKFAPDYFTGVYKLHDDGRRTATLHLKVENGKDVTGYYYSGTDGKKYEVAGKIGSVPHAVQFRVTFPRSVQTFYGMLFTGDGRIMTGTSVLQGRETGFYAVRQED